MTRQPVLKDPFFQTAVAFAKAIARAKGLDSLDLNLLAAGLWLACETHQGEIPEALAAESTSLSGAARSLGVGSAQVKPDQSEQTLPLSPGLRGLLAKAGESLTSLVPALLRSLAGAELDGKSGYEAIMVRAGSAARRLDAPYVSAELFAAAAWFAFAGGELKSCTTLVASMAASRASFLALIEERDWTAEVFHPDNNQTPIAFADEFIDWISGLGDDRDKLLAAINHGASAGFEILDARSTAYHEAGHAVCAFLLRPNIPIVKVSIEPGAGYAGVMVTDGSSSWREPRSMETVLAETCICLGGQAAERLAQGHLGNSTGVSSDLETATSRIWEAVTVFGMSDVFGPVSLSAVNKLSEKGSVWLTDEAGRQTQALLKECQRRTLHLLQENWRLVERLAGALIRQKTVLGETLVPLMVDRELLRWPGVMSAVSLESIREVLFASASGVHRTPEGPVQYESGDAIVTGAHGDSWPIARATFDRLYDPVGETTAGNPGRYRRIPRKVLAYQLADTTRIVLSDGRGVLSGGAGDWVVDYGDGDLAVVSEEAFANYYEQTGPAILAGSAS